MSVPLFCGSCEVQPVVAEAEGEQLRARSPASTSAFGRRAATTCVVRRDRRLGRWYLAACSMSTRRFWSSPATDAQLVVDRVDVHAHPVVPEHGVRRRRVAGIGGQQRAATDATPVAAIEVVEAARRPALPCVVSRTNSPVAGLQSSPHDDLAGDDAAQAGRATASSDGSELSNVDDVLAVVGVLDGVDPRRARGGAGRGGEPRRRRPRPRGSGACEDATRVGDRLPTNGDTPRELFLIDGNSLVYRAFFALPESIATSDGRPTNAIFGFASMLVKLLTEHGAQPTVVVWDAGSSGRKEVYAEYKGHRPKQARPAGRAVPAHGAAGRGVRLHELRASTASRPTTSSPRSPSRPRREEIPVTVVTGDRDAFQLVGDGVKVMATSRGITETKTYDRQDVIDRYGIPPELIPDFYGLKGDTSDNIPGVPGIGDKTAAQLLQQFGDLEGVLDEHRPDLRRQAQGEPDEPRRGRADLEACSPRPSATSRSSSTSQDELARTPDRARLREVFRDFELRDPLRRLEEALGDDDAAAPPPAPEQHGHGARHARRRCATSRSCRRTRRSTLAVARAGDARGRAASRSTTAGASASRPTARCSSATATRPRGRRRRRRRPAGHRARRQGARASSRRDLAHDTLLGAYLIEPARRAFPVRELVEERGAGHRRRGPGRRRRRAAARAGRVAARAHRGVGPDAACSTRSSCRSSHVLRGMEVAGVQAQRRRACRRSRDRVRDEIRDLEHDIWRLADDGVRHRLAAAARRDPLQQARPVEEAPRQDRLLHRRARAPGDPRRARDHPEDRALARAQPAHARRTSTCCPTSSTRARASTRRSTRRSRRRAGCRRRTRTCRTSRSARRSGARSAAASRPRRATSCVSADYSQVELRILAHVAGEDVLKEIFMRGEDVHTATASRGLRRRAPSADRPVDRSKAKMINYGIVYGLSDYGLADRLNIPREEAKAFIDAYLERFANVHAFMQSTIEQAARAGLRHDAVRPAPADPRAAGAQLAGAVARRAARRQHGHPGHGGRRAQARDGRARARARRRAGCGRG